MYFDRDIAFSMCTTFLEFARNTREACASKMQYLGQSTLEKENLLEVILV